MSGFTALGRRVRVFAIMCVIAPTALAQTDPIVVDFDIPAQPLNSALVAFSRQSGTQVSASAETLEGKMSSPVSGTLSSQTALSRLLAGTGLKASSSDSSSFVVAADQTPSGTQKSRTSARERSKAGVESTAASSSSVPNSTTPATQTAAPPTDAKKKRGEGDQSERSELPGRGTLEEVVVTAQKREERLLDVPVPVAVLNARELVERHQFRLQDYYTQVPGLNLVARNEGGSSISIRGVHTGGALNPTTGIVVDDVPFGASAAAQVSGNLLYSTDFDPSELARVEVLRGPQGTLYGASSMGGLIKFVTLDPTPDGFSGRLQVGTSRVEKGDDFGYLVQAAANAPLSDTWAVRLSASDRRDPGYIDNVQSGRDDVNRLEAQTVRLATLWQPFDGLKVKLSALYQNMELGGANDVHLPSPIGPLPNIGDLEQNLLINSGRLEQELQAYTAALTATLGRTELVSLTGYSSNHIDTAADVSPINPQTFSQFGVTGTVQRAHPNVYKFSQELRLTIPLGERMEWLLGGFYTRESTPSRPEILAINPANGNVVGTWLQTNVASTYEERAAFANVTFEFSDRFDVQAGLRGSRNEINYGLTSQGPFNTVVLRLPSATSVTPQVVAKDDPVTYSVTPRFRLSEDLMLYGRAASGYRPGGFNLDPRVIAAGVPPTYDHDTTENFELGLKGETPGGRLSFDASIYYIDWKDTQLQLRDALTLILYNLNAGGAKSEGVELSVDVRPLDGLIVSAWGAYNNAELTDVPVNSNLTAQPGDRLPYSARWSGHLSVNQEFALTSATTAILGGSFSYVGDRKGRFVRGFPQGTFPSYTQLDLQAGIRSGSWNLQAFVNNVADKRGVLRNGRDSFLGVLYIDTYTQPRTGGLNVSYSW